MAAQQTKPSKPHRQMPKPGSKTQTILTLATTTPATPMEIADTVNTSRQMVHQVMERYGIIPNNTESWKSHRADLLAALQEKIYGAVDEDAIKKMIMSRGMTDLGILYDKERIERGLSDNDTRPLVVIQVKGQATVNVDKPVDNCQKLTNEVDHKYPLLTDV